MGDYRCPGCGHGRPRLDIVARQIELRGLESTSFDLVMPDGTRRVDLPIPGLYNVYNALAAAALVHALGTGLDEIAAGLQRTAPAFGRLERISIDGRTVLMLLIKNPAGANEALRTLLSAEPTRVAVVALNDAIADGRDVSWIWDVDFEPFLEQLERVVTTGERASELALRFKYGGLSDASIEVVPDLQQALDRGLELTERGAQLVVLPTYTAMLALRRTVASRGHVAHYWKDAA
jgi:UDP-N-acetylmuramyl tripeptide synthase